MKGSVFIMRKLLFALYDQINNTTDESKRKDLFNKLIFLMNKKEFRGEVESILDLKDIDSHDLLFIEYLTLLYSHLPALMYSPSGYSPIYISPSFVFQEMT